MKHVSCQKDIRCWKVRHCNRHKSQFKNYSVQEATLKIYSIKLPSFQHWLLFPPAWWKLDLPPEALRSASGPCRLGLGVSASPLRRSGGSPVFPCHMQDLGASHEVAWAVLTELLLLGSCTSRQQCYRDLGPRRLLLQNPRSTEQSLPHGGNRKCEEHQFTSQSLIQPPRLYWYNL